ncbi:TetR/AcrR family transcriptional regulator [Micromonospora chokoriensis]
MPDINPTPADVARGRAVADALAHSNEIPGSSTSDDQPHRTRRNDPNRKTHILDATLDTIAEYGVAGTTHRRVAVKAGVPLGSITYHFVSLAELQVQAFTRYVELQSALYKSLFDGVSTPEQFVEVLVDLVVDSPARHRSAVLGFELHLAALRNPGLRTLTQIWTNDSRAILAEFTGHDHAARLDALLEGMIMQAVLETVSQSREGARNAIVQSLGPAGLAQK